MKKTMFFAQQPYCFKLHMNKLTLNTYTTVTDIITKKTMYLWC